MRQRPRLSWSRTHQIQGRVYPPSICQRRDISWHYRWAVHLYQPPRIKKGQRAPKDSERRWGLLLHAQWGPCYIGHRRLILKGWPDSLMVNLSEGRSIQHWRIRSPRFCRMIQSFSSHRLAQWRRRLMASIARPASKGAQPRWLHPPGKISQSSHPSSCTSWALPFWPSWEEFFQWPPAVSWLLLLWFAPSSCEAQ